MWQQRSRVAIKQPAQFCRHPAFVRVWFTMSKFANVLLVVFTTIVHIHFDVTEGTDEMSTDLHTIQGDRNMREIYTASWAVEITEGGDKMADRIASRYGLQNVGRVKIKTMKRCG